MASVWIQKEVKNWGPKGHGVIVVILLITSMDQASLYLDLCLSNE